MQQFLKRAGLFLLALFSAVCTLPYQASSAQLSGPEQTYYRAWQLVRDSYYDPTFNNQNWESWHHKFDGKLSSNEQAYDAVKQMLASLGDQYTRFLDPKAFKDEDDAINSFVCGIGISLRPYQEAKALVINDVIEGGPAARAGLQYGDEIIAINGEPATAINTDKAAEKIRGQAGTVVAITYKRGTGSKSVNIERQQITIPAVTTKILDGNIGYIKLATFMSDDASTEFRWALQKLSGTNGLVLDMRNNPGGLLANAVEIADMLMNRGKIVTTVSRHGRNVDSCTGNVMTQTPLVVLVDKDSASASEILAGALKDNARAVIVGTRTFGKGLVQEINRLPTGAGMHITVARYYTPNGSDINKIGINPDVEVTERDKQLSSAVATLQTKIASTNASHNGEIIALPPKQRPAASRVLTSPRS
jgi:carboxyl-terminal processing protease